MTQRMLNRVLIAALLVGALSVTAADANAGWWRAWHPGVCWSPCYSSCYTPCYSYSSCYTPSYSYTTSYCDPCATTTCGYYVGWRPGPLRRLLFGRYRWYYGCWTTPSYTVAYNDYPVVYEQSTSDMTQQPTPAHKTQKTQETQETQKPTDSETNQTFQSPETPQQNQGGGGLSPMPEIPAEPAPPQSSEPESSLPEPSGFDFNPLGGATPSQGTRATPQTSALVTVWVPHDARVIVNGYETKSSGSRRQFVSYGLKPGYEYEYEIRAQVPRDGKMIEDVQMVTLTAGGEDSVAFGFNRLPTESLAAGY